MKELIEFLKTHKLITTGNEFWFEPKIDNGAINIGDYWTINIPKGLTEEQAYQDCLKLFPCWRWCDNFDGIVSDRTSKKSYSIKVKANVEADEELKNLSAHDLKEKGIKGITLLERLVLEKDYFLKTGKHLDSDNITLCSGSRHSDGHVPYADFHDGWFHVDYYGPGHRSPNLRSRSVF
jgi:hypothetical protein